MASVPSAASTASTRPAATIAPWPASNSDSASSSFAPRARSDWSSADIGQAPRRPAGAARRGPDLVGPHDADPFALEDRRKSDQEAVVAAAKELRELGGALHRAPVEFEIGEFGPGHCADHHHLADPALLQRAKEPADLSHAQPDVRKSLDRRVGRADDADQKRLAPSPARFSRDLERKVPRAAQDGERRRGRAAGKTLHASSSLPARGTQIARSPPSRRKATICCTASSSGKASATSATRSFSAPFSANSIL